MLQLLVTNLLLGDYLRVALVHVICCLLLYECFGVWKEGFQVSVGNDKLLLHTGEFLRQMKGTFNYFT